MSSDDARDDPSGQLPTLLASGESSSERPAGFVTAQVAIESLTEPTLDRYQVVGEHARGGMGRILLARDARLGRPVVIKELLTLRDDSATLRFLREATLTARLQHPSVVPIHDVGRWPSGDPFYVMKLVQGKPLNELIRAGATLPERLALLPVVLAVAEAMSYAHSRHTGQSQLVAKEGPFTAVAAARDGRWLVASSAAVVTTFSIDRSGTALANRRFTKPAPITALAVDDDAVAATLLRSGALSFTDLATGHAWVRQHNVADLATGAALWAVGTDGTVRATRLPLPAAPDLAAYLRAYMVK